MDTDFLVHNTHRDGIQTFIEVDPHHRRLARQTLIWEDDLLDQLPDRLPGIYTLGGSRQVGKSTLLKQWMLRLIRAGHDPYRIAFFTGELIDDHHVLRRLLSAELEAMPASGLRFLLIDEVSYIAGWDRAVKFLADSGNLEQAVVVLTGSDLGLIRDARTFLPGRRGRADEVDFHLHPLTWMETGLLTGAISPQERSVLENRDHFDPESLCPAAWERCRSSLDQYLVHGGFLTALNDYHSDGGIRSATLATYSDWIRGDMLKRGKSETYLREVVGAIIDRLGSQVTWNALARALSIDHPSTVADYVHLLERMDAVFVRDALKEDRLTGAPKKARKLAFTDPFIFHAARTWLKPSGNPFRDRIRPLLEDPGQAGALVEGVVAAHARRHFPTFYIKATGEVDVAIVSEGRFFPIEVKWGRQIHPSDLKQVAKYSQGRVAAPVTAVHEVAGVPVLPLPRVLALLGRGIWPAERDEAKAGSSHR